MVGTAAVGSATDPMHFRTMLNLPNTTGAHNLVAYAHSSVRGQVGKVSVPFALGVDPSKAMLGGTGAESLTCTP